MRASGDWSFRRLVRAVRIEVGFKENAWDWSLLEMHESSSASRCRSYRGTRRATREVPPQIQRVAPPLRWSEASTLLAY